MEKHLKVVLDQLAFGELARTILRELTANKENYAKQRPDTRNNSS